MQTRIPCLLMRGGTSKGAYFLPSDLPSDLPLRDRVLLAVMGSPDARQIDGLGGADPLTSKVAIVGRSNRPGIDLDYLFCQVKVGEAEVDITPNCGNMLAGVAPFAIERGLVPADDPLTRVRIHMENSGNVAEATVRTPGGVVDYTGEAHIDGVPGTAAPLLLDFLDTAGSACGSLLPTGNLADEIAGTTVTCIDNGMPVVVIRAADLDRTGYENRDALNADTALKSRLEEIRLAAGPRMNLGDVANKVVPKMCLVAPPKRGGTISTRTFIPHLCHASVGVLGAVTVATACVLEGTTANGLAAFAPDDPNRISVEHPAGEFSVDIEVDRSADPLRVRRSALLRTTRPIMDGHVLIPESVWAGAGHGA